MRGGENLFGVPSFLYGIISYYSQLPFHLLLCPLSHTRGDFRKIAVAWQTLQETGNRQTLRKEQKKIEKAFFTASNFYESQQANKCPSKSAVLSLQSMYIPTYRRVFISYIVTSALQHAQVTVYPSQRVANRYASRI